LRHRAQKCQCDMQVLRRYRMPAGSENTILRRTGQRILKRTIRPEGKEQPPRGSLDAQE
jgi:hypothetical protein